MTGVRRARCRDPPLRTSGSCLLTTALGAEGKADVGVAGARRLASVTAASSQAVVTVDTATARHAELAKVSRQLTVFQLCIAAQPNIGFYLPSWAERRLADW